MRIVKSSVAFAFILIPALALAQKSDYKEGHVFGATVYVGPGSFADALSWSHYYGIGKRKRLNVGYGLRLTNFFGSDQDYLTAPAKYTSGKSSLAALFTETINENIDTINFASTQTNSLNLGIYVKYILPLWKNRIELGLNIDAIGFTAGASQKGQYRNAVVAAKPTAFNLLLISDSDIGSLNSEWYVGVSVNKKLTVRAGYEFLFTEFTTSSKVQQIPDTNEFNDRFRLKSSMILLGIAYMPFRK